ncbi:Zn-ribbon domain-containing OB-fold protein [Saccharopolyspora spinosa]|uniref:OB-fold protein n=1 Tax=Saccharopolyspora spinosa TaxID=60894 RepID=A0A2N3Y1R3_SACSN|nr:Zn-ribbon domain-containing OB-fold protein [Saccharopolyspora spinosa]PKW16842.1 hypothetical protein A8926_4736 [Saccharopolyspora spinosa]
MELTITPETRLFWDGIAAGELRMQRCENCMRAVFYPRSHCPHCHSDDLRWHVVSGQGTVHAYTVAHRAPGEFAEQTPFTLALIDLDDGPRMLTRIVGDGRVTIGARVTLEIARLSPDSPELPCFRVTPSAVHDRKK